MLMWTPDGVRRYGYHLSAIFLVVILLLARLLLRFICFASKYIEPPQIFDIMDKQTQCLPRRKGNCPNGRGDWQYGLT
jgi:hypothetical protein